MLGVGNVLLSDEGMGIKAVEELKRRYSFNTEVELLDGGTLGLDLLYFLEGTDRLLIIDAVLGGNPPGFIYKFRGDEVKTYFRRKVSAHEIGIQEVLAVAEITGRYPEEIVVIGMEPESLDISLELSQTVRNNFDKLLNEVLDQLREWGIEVKHAKDLS